MGKSTRDPLQPVDFFSDAKGVPDPFFGQTKTRETQGKGIFSPGDYEHIKGATPFDDMQALDDANASGQTSNEMVLRSMKQFGANVASSVGQGLANTFDFVAHANTIKSELTGSVDDYNSKLFGLTTKDMQDWANGVAERNKIYEKNPGSFSPSDPAWWATQFASSGTGVGMGLEALGETAAIEFATGGVGTGAAIANLGKLVKNIGRGAKGVEILNEAAQFTKGLKSAATVYGTISRLSESRMEAMNTYAQIVDEMGSKKNSDGTPKYTEDEVKHLASEGAKRDFNGNMLLLPLDILSYRTMVFNPISGSGTGLLEKGLEKVAGVFGKSTIGKAAGWLTTHAIGSATEGAEEGFQQLAQNEGQHYAEVLGGLDDGSSFVNRMAKGAQTDDFWNNVAGGIIGSPVIGAFMNATNHLLKDNSASKINDIHSNYIKEVGKMDNVIAGKIKELEDNGKTQEASVLRRQFGANKALDALHLDALTDKETAFDSRVNFLQGTLDELNSGKTDALNDLGFFNTTPEQIETIKKEFTDYLADAHSMKNIYDQVKQNYNRNFVPTIAQQHFQLERLSGEVPGVNNEINDLRTKLPQYNDLSTQGKEIHDIEYTLTALKQEEARLTNLHKITTNTQEKDNVSKLLDEVKENQTKASERLKEINDDSTYDPSTKRTDGEILNSSIKNKNYQQAIYDREHLNNAIRLQRKNLSLWDTPQYHTDKLKQSVTKAKSKDQVEAIKQEVATNPATSPEVKEAIDTKQNEIATNEVVGTAVQPSEVPGNSNLFGEDNDIINDLKGVVGTVTPSKSTVSPSGEIALDENQNEREPEYLLSPASYDFNNSSEEAKAKVKNGVSGLLDKLSHGASFEDLVRHVVRVQGEGTADNLFNALKYGWEANDKAPVDYDAVYQKVFGNPMDELIAGASQLIIKGSADLEKENDKITEGVAAHSSEPDFDNNNQPTYTYKGTVTNESSPKLAFSTRLAELVQTIGEDGNIVVNYDYTENELNTGDYIDSLQLLDPDKFNAGTELVIRIPLNVNDIKIPIYNADGTKSPSMTFGAYMAQNNLTQDSQEYRDKLPMIIYRKGAATNEKGVAFVHDIGWYHPLRFNQQNKDDMAKAIEQTRAIREEVLGSKSNSVPVTITSKRQTTFAGLKTAAGTNISLREANPQTQLTIALDSNSLSTSKRNQVFPNNESLLMNNSPFSKGQIIEVRRYGTKDGVNTYIGFPVTRPKLSAAHKTSVLQAINIYASRNNQDATIRASHDKAHKQIQDAMGIDIKDSAGLEQYLNHFILVHGERSKKSNEEVEARMKSVLAPGTPYIAFIAGGNIVFGRAGEAAYVDRAGNKRGSFFINPSSNIPAGAAIGNLAKPNMLGWYEYNLNLDNLNKNKKVMLIDGSGNTTVGAESYNDFLLDNLQTNIRSHNIGTAENPNYVTNVQPIITYDTNKRLEEASNIPTSKEVGATINTTEEIPTEDIKDTTVSDLAARILEEAKRDLGSDYGISKDNSELLEPAELTDAQREQITSSINRIAGLTPNQQFDIVDFMYNQVTGIVNLDTKQADKAEVDKQVRAAFKEAILPSKTKTTDKIAELKALVEAHPSLIGSGIPDTIKDYEYRLTKIKAVENNISTLIDETYNRVAKYTGITQGKVRDEEGDDTDGSEITTDFWTDVLSESPDNKLTYSMRRFFGQVAAVNKEGKPIQGFLGLPTYVGSDTVIRTLMTHLADVPSNFEDMIAKMQQLTTAIPWMQSTIDKLKAASQQSKNQFVTVMSNTRLRMKFTMISYDQRTNSWTTKLWDTALTGIADSVRQEWKSGFIDSNLTLADDEGNYMLNDKRAQVLIDKFKAWKGLNLKSVEGNIADYWDNVVSKVKNDTTMTFTPTGSLLTELKTNLVKNSDRMKFSLKGKEYQISNVGDNRFKVDFLKQAIATKQEVEGWLKEFGINLHPETLNELYSKGLYHNYKQRTWDQLFETGVNTNGLLGILYGKITNIVDRDTASFDEEGGNPLDDSVITSLANLEAKYNTTNTPFGMRDNGKPLFALTAPKFITDRVRDLKMKDSVVAGQLRQISFSQSSLWLRLLTDDKFNDKFQLAHMGLNAFKQLGKRLYKDNGLVKLSDVDHELTKLGMFWDKQGEVSYLDNTGVEHTTYPDTDIALRMSTMFSPTMSDKDMMTLITTAVLDLRNKDLGDGQGISDQVTKVLYEQTVKPELLRMIKFYQNGGTTNIEAYNKGAGLFMLMSDMNNIEYAKGLRLINAIKHAPDNFTSEFIESNEELMKDFNTRIKAYVDSLVKEKLSVWENNGYIKYSDVVAKNEDGTESTSRSISELKFFDKRYIANDRLRGTNEEKVKMAAMDFVVNSLVSNANSFMLLAGDPALYFKSKATDPVLQARESFVNVGKRLANQIAPGTTLSNSEDEKYIQLFLQDRTSVANNLEYLEKLIGKEKAAAYKNIEASDAQEYTTWKEHLDILAKLGRVSNDLAEVTPEEIQAARDLFSTNKDKSKLTEKELALIGKVMQPMKPVYTGQVYDKAQDVMRTMYIKSSSFPLIPQLTQGMEIDKLRVAMEKVESDKKMNVRASYQSANKVGALNNAANVWSDSGAMNSDIDWNQHQLVLDRKNFRIQQEVPFKSGRTTEDQVTLGTQLMKLLFGDGIMDNSKFSYNGETLTGKELYNKYNDLFTSLIKEKQGQLFTELGLDDKGVPVDNAKAQLKLQSILKEEATKRGYPLQDIEGLRMTEQGDFNLPLWASSNSNRYESMLNSIVSNRMIRTKFPGNSYVLGSEEGFKTKVKEEDDLTPVEKSRIIYTPAWNGTELQAGNGTNAPQVFVASKFRTNDGDLINLFEKIGTEYKYITETDTGFKLKDDMIDKELLSLIGFRIPTSGHQSASQVEIAGFLPFESADLIITPKNFTKQMGSDFDIDKLNTYQYWHHVNADGKIEMLKEEHRAGVLLSADKEMQDLLKGKNSSSKMLASIFGNEITYNKEDIEGNKLLTKVNSRVNEKLKQNEIIKIHHSIYGSTDPATQSKIVKTLHTEFAEEQANFIDSLETAANPYWTPLSDEYQKQKMMTGAGGKIGTGAYSLDVVFHSLVQQAATNNRPIQLNELIEDEEGTRTQVKTWRFGNIESNGQLGNTRTLDGARTIAEVQSERQNIAVDNEKLQVMGRVNLNDITLDVDKIFNLLGFDRGNDGHSISMLFLSQPIIKEYVNQMKNANSNMADYDANREQNVVDSLLNKYDVGTTEIDDNYWKNMSDLMTNDNFVSAIKDKGGDGKLQGAVLRRFIEMKNYGVAIRGIQTTINFRGNSLGKSFFDVIEKRNALNRLGTGNSLISGATGLIGSYVEKGEKTEFALTQSQMDNLIDEGYQDIGDFMVKPDTIMGEFNISGTNTAYNLWNKYFPYDSEITLKAFNEVMGVVGRANMGATATTEMKQDIFKSMKKYFSASRLSGVINSTDDINSERARLYIDSATNTSLAKYVKTLREMTGNKVVAEYIQANKLFNRFEFDIQKNGQPSLIKYNNAKGEEFDEQYLYESLSTLIEKRGPDGKIELPEIGNKKYTLDTLAQDLIAYSYLGNATQEAIQFTKYVPVSYLNTVGYSDLMRKINSWLDTNPNILGVKVGTGTQKHLVSEFTMQYVQHNPEKVQYKLDSRRFAASIVEANSTNINKLQSFKLKTEDNPPFISIYNSGIPKGEKKFQLYWFDGAQYTKIPVLGAFGMDEFQPRTDIGQSLVNGRVRISAQPQSSLIKTATVEGDTFDVSSGNIETVVQNIINQNIPGKSELATMLLPFVTGLKIKYEDETALTKTFAGLYSTDTDTISISPRETKNYDSSRLAGTILHEVIHGLTTKQIIPYIEQNDNGDVQVVNNAPGYVSDLVRLFNDVRGRSDTTELKAIIDKVRETGRLGTEDLNTKYGLTNIFEFMSMSLTNPEFQKYLSKTEFKQSGTTLLEKFKQIINSMLKALGVNFDNNTATAHAINSIFEFIEKENGPKTGIDDINQQMWDDTMNNEGLTDGDEPVFSFLPNTENFPNKQLDIQEEKCI